MRHDPGEIYTSVYPNAGDGKCWEMFHPELDTPYCGKDLDHEDGHEGFGLGWSEEPQVDSATAERFLRAYRKIPNSNHEITLDHDGTVTMTLNGLEAAARFIGVNMRGEG